jgi:hypothetical protein
MAADVEYGKVVSKTPVYVQVAVPERQCVSPAGDTSPDAANQSCQVVTRTENRFVAYDVTYEYKGQRYTARMLRDPGERIALTVKVMPAAGVEEAPVEAPPYIAPVTSTAPPAVVYSAPSVVYVAPPVVYGPPVYWGPRFSVGFGWGWGGYRHWR